jgi:sporulation protein YlmC with PRC-barrel domain
MEITSLNHLLAQTIPVKSLIGKPVLWKDGTELGAITRVHVRVNKKIIAGVSFSLPNDAKQVHFLGSEFIQTVSPNEIITNIMPSDLFTDKQIYDAQGNLLGTVQSVVCKKDESFFEGMLEIKKAQEISFASMEDVVLCSSKIVVDTE